MSAHPLRRQRQAKIVATLGPASSTHAEILALVDAGADVFRFNFSHGSHEEHQARCDIVRANERECGRPIAVLADLQGSKLRVGQFGLEYQYWNNKFGNTARHHGRAGLPCQDADAARRIPLLG